jgi:hypothetical protein
MPLLSGLWVQGFTAPTVSQKYNVSWKVQILEGK